MKHLLEQFKAFRSYQKRKVFIRFIVGPGQTINWYEGRGAGPLTWANSSNLAQVIEVYWPHE